MKYKTDDLETISLVRENNSDAKDVLYEKYSYIIDIIIKKYKRSAYLLQIDLNDLYQEAMLGFTDAINTYKDDKEAGLATFITICVERKIQNTIKKANTKKNKVILESLSLEQPIDNKEINLGDVIPDNKNNPLTSITDDESYKELVESIEKTLSKNELEVYKLMINNLNYQEIAIILEKEPKQIDNAIQRIRLKIKKMLDK